MNHVLDTVLDFGFFNVDNSKRICYVSPQFCKRFSVIPENMNGKSIDSIIEGMIQGKNSSIFFCKVLGYPCLIKIEKKNSTWTYWVLIRKDEIDSNVLISFLNTMESKSHKRKSIQTCHYQYKDIIGNSPAITRVKELASKIANSNSTVLLTGESGTGKELFAQVIHEISARKNHPFIAVNCVAIPDELFESELFGYEAGAFSGARKDGKPGKIELAQNGTLFLDEISELSYQSQGKLLRVLQEREIERLGGTSKKKVDIRIIAATNKDLKELVQKGKFRQDLYYRLYVFDLQIPPLRQRREDILLLTYVFIKEYNQKFHKNVSYIDPQLEDWLVNYDWPGNVRELKATIERGMNIVEGDTLTMDMLYFNPNHFVHKDCESEETSQICPSLDMAVRNTEIQIIKRALKEANGDKMIAAQKLKIHVASLYRKIAKYNLK